MANLEDDRNDGWVEARIASLAAEGVVAPDAVVVLNRLRARDWARLAVARRWIWSTSVAGVAAIALLCVPASRACVTQPGTCLEKMLGTPVKAPVAPEVKPVMMAAVQPHAATAVTGRAKAQAPVPRVNFKSEGAADAPVTLEVYIDYDCVHCANFVRDVVPELRREYVATGRLRLLWRDFPMPSHRFAMLAARYADAAGALGYYGAAMEQIFATREEWDVSGDVDGSLAKVMPAEVMAQVREHLQTDAAVAAGIEADHAAAEADHLNHTPFAVVVLRDGTREAGPDELLSLEALRGRIEGR